MKSTKEKIEDIKEYINLTELGKIDNVSFSTCHGSGTAELKLDIEPFTKYLKTELEKLDEKLKSEEPQTDWSKIARGTAVLVRDNDDDNWIKGYFNSIINGSSCGYEFNIVENECGESNWVYCKLDKSAPSIINWLPIPNNIGELKHSEVLVRDDAGYVGYVFVHDIVDGMVEYAIIE